MWQDFTFDGDYNKARCHVWCNMFKRCDIHDKVVSLYVEDNLLKLDFNGTILTKKPHHHQIKINPSHPPTVTVYPPTCSRMHQYLSTKQSLYDTIIVILAHTTELHLQSMVEVVVI